MKRHTNKEFFTHNRERIAAQLEGGVLIASAYADMQRSHDAAHKFTQEANFWYLTGIERPDWLVVIDSERGKTMLVSPDVDPVHALFDGSLSTEDALQMSGADEVTSQAELKEQLAEYACQNRTIYTVDQPSRAEKFGFTLNPAAQKLRQQLETHFSEVHDARPLLARLRAIKQPSELAVIQRAIDITAKTLASVYKNFQTYAHEYEIEAAITHGFRTRGASGHAYDPIVAAGANACTLHYGENNAMLQPSSLVLLDVGAEVEQYAADITRTYSFGEPTQRQRDVFAAVHTAHKDIIALLAPGLSVQAYSDKVDKRMKQALIELGLISAKNDDVAYRKYFPHAISHGLGLDVHDSLGAPQEFAPNMVLTVEPGIYIPEEGIGVRIEDDILITANGRKNLSAQIPVVL